MPCPGTRSVRAEQQVVTHGDVSKDPSALRHDCHAARAGLLRPDRGQVRAVQIDFGQLLADNLHLHRPEQVELIFGRRITRRAPGQSATWLINRSDQAAVNIPVQTLPHQDLLDGGPGLAVSRPWSTIRRTAAVSTSAPMPVVVSAVLVARGRGPWSRPGRWGAAPAAPQSVLLSWETGPLISRPPPCRGRSAHRRR
jgi:hypothetical protein